MLRVATLLLMVCAPAMAAEDEAPAWLKGYLAAREVKREALIKQHVQRLSAIYRHKIVVQDAKAETAQLKEWINGLRDRSITPDCPMRLPLTEGDCGCLPLPTYDISKVLNRTEAVAVFEESTYSVTGVNRATGGFSGRYGSTATTILLRGKLTKNLADGTRIEGDWDVYHCVGSAKTPAGTVMVAELVSPALIEKYAPKPKPKSADKKPANTK